MAKEYSIFTSFKAKDGMTPAFNSMVNGANKFTQSLGSLADKGSSLSGVFKNIQSIKNMQFPQTISSWFSIIKSSAGQVKNIIQPCIDSASDLNETVQKTDETFKSNAATVKEWANTSITNMGLSKQTALDTAALYGDMGTGMGLSTDRAAEMSMTLTQLSADMASFKNVSQETTSNALKSVFTGETETLKNLGVVMTQENLQEFAKKSGIKKKFKDLTQNEKIEIRYNYVMANTKNSQGDFLRTLGGFANQQRVGEELKKEYQQRLGDVMLPTFTKFAKLRNNFLSKNLKSVVENFSKIFAYISNLAKLFKPVFSELKKVLSAFGGDTTSILTKLAPLVTLFVKDILVPALTLTLKTLLGVYNFLKGFCNFVKNNLTGATLLFAGLFVLASHAVGRLQVQMSLARMEGGLLAILMRTKMMTALTGFSSKVLECMGKISKAFMAGLLSPTGLAIAGIAALVSIVIILWKNWDKVTEYLKNFWNWCKEIFSNFANYFKENVVDIILSALGPIGLVLRALSDLGVIKLPSLDATVQHNANIISSAPYNQKTNNNGQINVDVKLTNGTDKNATTSTKLISGDNLKLKPA
jgi:hypothetical protein